MKKFNRFLSYLLIASICTSLFFVSAGADDSVISEETIANEETAAEETTIAPEAEQETTVEMEEPSADDSMDLMDYDEVHTETLTYINPIYADILSEDDLVQPSSEPSSDEMALFDASDYIDTLEEAGDILRAGFVAREESTVITVDLKNGYFAGLEFEDILAAVISEALMETDDPTCGDYIRYQYGGCSAGISYTSSWVKLAITTTYYTTAEQEAVVTSTVDDVIASLDLDGKDEDYKVAKIYDYITSHVVYDYENLGNQSYLLQYTAYAALINGTSVCQGYANLFYRLCREAGISARIISGTGNGGPHAWNIVRIGNLYYDVDSTWDAEKSPAQYGYFLKCDANFANHVRESFDNDTDYTSAAFYAEYPMSDTDYGYPESAKVAANGLVLSSTPRYIMPGESCTITAEVLPKDVYDGTVAWSISAFTVGFSRTWSSNYIIITPTGSEGHIVVTATTADGAFSDSMTVYVSATAHEHTEEIIPGIEATCTEPGLTEGVICSVCGETLTEQTEIPALGHTEEIIPGKAATYTETGLTDGVRCSVCGEILVEQEVIPVMSFSAPECLGHTLTLDESICLNYYFGLPEALLNDSGANVVFMQNDEVITEIPVADAVQKETDGILEYSFSVDLVTKELADNITAVIVDSEGNESEPFVYSAKQYCEELIELYQNDAELVALVKSLMNYGASAQEYFGYNTDNLVNSSLSEEDKVVSSIDDGALSQYVTSWEREDAFTGDISFYGVTLDLLADLNMRLYFHVPDGRSIEDYTFTIADNGDNPVTLETGTGAYGPYARISNIYSADIDAEYIVSIYCNGEQVGWVNTSPFAYINSSLGQSGISDDLSTLLYALYHYNVCADTYFGA